MGTRNFRGFKGFAITDSYLKTKEPYIYKIPPKGSSLPF